ncbi:MAG: phosphoadenosine phosphosulfate reductase family protein [Anaerolineaceae bacterium]|nr:phosphoadenosine phosphosulfate reductase family protein [Anaerolineaceae bacterium]
MKKVLGHRAYWCDSCHVPLLGEKCLACGKKGRDLASGSLVPVFRPEIMFLRKTIGNELKKPIPELETWVLHTHYSYFVQGVQFLKLSRPGNGGPTILEQPTPLRRSKKVFLEALRRANEGYVKELQYEAENFIRETALKFIGSAVLVSFSGGKDSTVVSNLVMNALGRSDILHIFADTTIELPDTYEYLKKFKLQHPLTPLVACKSPLDFFDTAKKIGPPSRILRWCCTTHKTNPLSKLIKSMSPDKGVLTFDGVRRSESPRRSNYPRISVQHKIRGESIARPILNWSDFQVWIYMLFHGLEFNDAYKKGLRRVGCLHCPFNSDWSMMMINYRYPEEGKLWHEFLLEQAHDMNHPNIKVFAKRGWRVRAGGRGLDFYKSSIESAPCLLSDSAITYQILGGDIRLAKHFLRPLGPQVFLNNNQYSESFIIQDRQNGEIFATVEVSFSDEAIRVNYLKKKNRRLFQQRVEKQIRKLQSCIYCGACEEKCPSQAITTNNTFYVNADKCVNCLDCVSHNCPAVKALHFQGENRNGRV